MSKSRLQYESLRTVTSAADEKLGRTRRCGVASADQFFDLPDDDNVREYLQAELNGKPIKLATEGSVNHAIWETLENRRQDFTLLNAGLTIVHGDATVYDKDRYVDLVNASIINGSQTRGVLREFSTAGSPTTGTTRRSTSNWSMPPTWPPRSRSPGTSRTGSCRCPPTGRRGCSTSWKRP
jgi:hypothetical protein